MPTLTASGIGSGLDVNSLVSQLVAAERAPIDARLNSREAKATALISALGSLRGALSSFKTALEALKTESALLTRKATSGNEDLFTASADGDSVSGSYEVEVLSLAKAHQLASAEFAEGATAVVGTGTLTITSGENTFSLTIDSTNNTLEGIRDAINSSDENTSVQATLVHEANGTHLVITARDSGAENQIEVAASGGDGGLDQLVFDPDGTQNLDEVQAATDAHVRIAGFDVYSSTNTVEGAIDGVTLNLKAAEEGTLVKLDVVVDDSAIVGRIKKFVTEFNTLNDTFRRLRSYSPETRTAAPLLGDAMLRSIEEQVSRGLSDPVTGLTGDLKSLASIGITRQLDGKLAIDEQKLNAVLASDANGVAAIFSSENGVAARLYEKVDSHLVSGGDIASRNESLQQRVESIKDERERVALRMASVEARLRRQFSALDALLSRMQSTSNYLASQLANLPTPGKD